ncbi:MAG TPA: GWxTD domain-containing protein [Candidatus Krumholzibacteria bacterium]
MKRLPLLLLVAAAWAVPLATSAGTRSGDDAVRRATEMLARGDTTGAIDVLEHSHLDSQDNPRAYILLGRTWRDLGTIDSRLRSQQVLERARLRFPDDPDVLVELGRTYFAQRFFPDAIGCLDHALDADPKRCDARYLIGLYYYRNWKRLNQYTDDLDAARRHLRSAWQCDPSNAAAARLYLYACYALADTSAREANQMVAQYPKEGSLQLYRGVLAFDAGQYDLCGRYFERGLALLPPDERAVYDDLSSVLPANALGKYQDLGLDARSAFIRGYWLQEDPDPTTDVNERELEHIYRVFVSDMLFSNDWTGRRGWACDRGGTLIKLGRPLSIDHSIGRGQDGHIETWTYERGGELRQFLFVDEFLNGDPRIPYDDDYALHNLLHDPEFTSIRSPTADVPGILAVTAFRDDDLHASLYIAMHVDADTVEAHALPGSTNMYLLRGALFDTGWNREGGNADTLWTSQLPPRIDSSGRSLEFVRRVSAPFGAYRVAWSMQDEHARMRALARGDADARRFAGDALALSDVLLYDDAGDDHPAAAGLIERGGMRMLPRIERRFRADEPLRAYLEVYSLGVLQGECEYEVRYSIYPGKNEDAPVWSEWAHAIAGALGFQDDDPVISQSFNRKTTEHRASEYIAIDIGALEPGRYELLVEVMDLNSGQSAVQHTGFSVEAGTSARR